MSKFIIQFTNSGKTVNIFKGTNALDCQFVLDYKFDSRETAEAFAKDLLSKNSEDFTAKIV